MKDIQKDLYELDEQKRMARFFAIILDADLACLSEQLAKREKRRKENKLTKPDKEL